MCIFPSDGISRIRFTGQGADAHSQPVLLGSPKTLGNTAQLRLRVTANLLRQLGSFQTGKYIQYSSGLETLIWHKIFCCASLPNCAVLPYLFCDLSIV